MPGGLWCDVKDDWRDMCPVPHVRRATSSERNVTPRTTVVMAVQLNVTLAIALGTSLSVVYNRDTATRTMPYSIGLPLYVVG